MKRLINNLKSSEDILNVLLIAAVLVIVKTSNGVQYVKMGYYKIRGIPCYMYRDQKFGEKTCYRLKNDSI
jgi:hypothetical protein